MLNKKRFRLALIGITIASTLFACTHASCSTYNLNNTNGVDYCYEIGTTAYLPGNTTTKDVPFTFDAYGNFTSEMNFVGITVNYFSNTRHNAYGRKNGTIQKLRNKNTSDSKTAYNYTGACLGSTSTLGEYGARNYTCGDDNYNATFITNEAIGQLNMRGNINLMLISYADGRTKFCFVSESTTDVLCYGVGPEEQIEIPSNVNTPYTYTNIGSNYFTTSPYAGGGNGGGTTTITTGTICPMIQFQIDMYGRKYNTGLCYTNNIEYTGGSVQTVTPKDIFEIFNSYTDYINRYNLRNNNCHAPYTQEHCTNVMSENRRAIQIFNKIEKAGVDSEKVYQYCHLQLHFTDEQKRTLGTCQIEEETDQPQYATGTNQQNSNPNPLEGLTNALQNGTLDEPPVPNTGTVFDEILPDGVLSRKDVLLDYNFYSHFSMLYIKITKLFQARGQQDGIIPPYITSLLLLILLFKIYKK